MAKKSQLGQDEQSKYRVYLVRESKSGCKIQENIGSISCPTLEMNERFRDALTKKKEQIRLDEQVADGIMSRRSEVSPELVEVAKNLKEFNRKRNLFVDDEIRLAETRIKSMKKAEERIVKEEAKPAQ